MTDDKSSPKPAEQDANQTPEEAKNLDRDGRERQPTEQTDHK